MIVIPISGIIADWEMENESNVTPRSLSKSLEAADGQPVRIDINSPGGDVFLGLEMFNLIKNYPGMTETRIVSMAASMGSIIALAGKKRTAEKTAAYIIHNAWGISIGDYRDMRNAADDLEAVTAHLANIYTDRAGVDNGDVRRMMDRETWFYGENLSEFGFEIVETESMAALSENRIVSKNRYEAFIKEQEKHSAEARQSLKQVAASIGSVKNKSGINEKPGNENVNQPAANAGNNISKEISAMTVEELKAQNPDVYKAVFQAGVDQEKDRVKAHLTIGESAGCLDLAVKNIREDAEFTQTVNAEYLSEGMKNRDISNRFEDENNLQDLDNSGDADADTDEKDTASFAAKLKARNAVKGAK